VKDTIQDTLNIILYYILQSRSTIFLCGRRLLCNDGAHELVLSPWFSGG